MKLSKFIPKNFLLTTLIVSLCGFVILSWWLLFRDERALVGFEATYPFFNGWLFSTREFLLNYSLNVLPTVLFMLFALISFGAYFLLLKKEFTVKKVIKWSLIFQALIFLSYPVLSTDIYYYIFSDRVSSQYEQNKWLVAPNSFSFDIFEQFTDWKDKTNVYGFVNHIIYLPAANLGNDAVFTTLLLYKLTVAVFAVASLFVFIKLLEGKESKEKSHYLKMIFWNPLFLLEILGSAHNDMLMLFFLLVSLLFWQKKNLFLAGIFLAFSVQVKLIPIIFFGFFALYLLQMKNIFGLLKYVGSFLLITVLGFIFMQVDPLVFMQRVLYNAASYWQSLPALFTRFFPGIQLPFTLIFGVIILLFIFLQLKKKLDPILSSEGVFLIYFSFFTGAYWNWYVLWIFMLVPFIKDSVLRNTILVLSFTSLLAYPILWFSYRFGFENQFWSIFTYLFIFGIPIGYLGYNKGSLKGTTQ